MRIGPMFSGKTSWLNYELTSMADKQLRVLKIVHSSDTRKDVAVCSESGTTHNSSYTCLSPKITVIRATHLSLIDINSFHVIGIDEAHFFHDLLPAVENWVENKSKHVRVAGLDGDFRRERYGQILDLIPISDEVKKLKATCKICLDKLVKEDFYNSLVTLGGSFSKRTTDCEEQTLVGGSDMYIPVCRFHYFSSD